MKKYILVVLMAIVAIGGYSQTMTDNQVMEMIMQEHQRGSSQAQIVTKLMQSGVNINQIRRVRNMYERMQKGSGLGNMGTRTSTDDRTRRNNGNLRGNVKRDDVESETRRISRDNQQEADRYSVGRVSEFDTDATPDEYNDQYLEMTDEMNDWLPADTAAMYRQLLRQVRNDKKKIYGHDFFNNKNLSFEPNMNIATPANYRLGPGDAVYVDIYGATQKSIESTVSPDGYITIEGYGPVQVSGLTVAQANARLRSTMGARYQSSRIRLSVGQTRTITVNVMGEVRNPGTYTVSAFATVFHALYMAGGPNQLGTLRNVKVYRNNRLVSVVDIYDYLLNGKQSGNIKLGDNDIVIVGSYDCLVNIAGKVKRPMYYEMKKSESVGTLIKYAGGFSGDAYTQSVRVIRKTGKEYSIFNVNEFDMSSFRVADGDSVYVDSIIPRYENMVEVKGAVFRPGMYQLGDEINSVRSLVEAAGGVTEYAFQNRAVMHRMKEDRHLEVVQVDLKGILDGSVADIPLKNEDVLFIATRQDAKQEQYVSIRGEVYYPGQYKYADNETLEDFILQAGGLTNTASTSKIDVSRRIYNPSATTSDTIIAKTYSFSLKDGFVVEGEPGFKLKPYDEVYVRKSPGSTEQENIEVRGEVMFAGAYTLPKRNTRLSDIVKAVGGFSESAYVEGARLERRTNADERARMEKVLQLAQENQQETMLDIAARSSNAGALTQVMQQQSGQQMQKFNVPEYYPVVIHLKNAVENPGGKDDIVLREGDRVVVPEYTPTVKINGAVAYPNTVSYLPGKSVGYYINRAGGFSSKAKKRETYILYMNGDAVQVGHNVKVLPGCEIYVPTKATSKRSMAETMSIGSSAASIAAVIATIANLVK